MRPVRARLLLLCPLGLVALACGSAKTHAQTTTRSTPQTLPPAPLAASFRANTHRPRVNTIWRYVVRTRSKRPDGGPIQSQVHVRVHVNGVWVDFGASSFVGAYHDLVSWPPSARGKLLIFAATVQQDTRSRTFRFWLRPR